MQPHVTIDVRMLNSVGVATYLRHIVPMVVTARPEWRFTLLGDPQHVAALGLTGRSNVAVRSLTTRIYTVGEQVALRAAMPKDVDLFWAPHYNIPIAATNGAKLVANVHDVIHLARPEYSRNPVKRAYARFMFEAVRRKADVILTCSAFTRDEFTRLVGPSRGPFVVTPYGVDAAWFEPVPHAPVHARPYLLFVGAVKPHKNLSALVRAFEQLQYRIPHDLVIVGRREGLRTGDADVERVAGALGDRVRFTGEVDFATLRGWFAGAAALVQPSLYEGFGFPPLEAMAVGVPSVVARAGSLPEVCGDAVLYCDPLNPTDIADQIHRLLHDAALRADLRERGRARAGEYRWERTRNATLGVLDNVLRV